PGGSVQTRRIWPRRAPPSSASGQGKRSSLTPPTRAFLSLTCLPPAMPTGSWLSATSDPESSDGSCERMDNIMKGETMVINGDRWTVVDVAPAAPLAEMVAALLEDEGYVVMVRGLDLHSDTISHLGTTSVMTTYVLVPEGQAEAATKLIA